VTENSLSTDRPGRVTPASKVTATGRHRWHYVVRLDHRMHDPLPRASGKLAKALGHVEIHYEKLLSPLEIVSWSPGRVTFNPLWLKLGI
jgi:hypothetical protein